MKEPDSKEQMSAFMDGELRGSARDRVIAALYDDAELRRTWARFHLIGDAARRTVFVPGAESIADRVGEVLDGERTVAFRPRPRRFASPWVYGPALAASVAAVAVLGIRGLDPGGQAPVSPVAGEPRPEVAPARPDPAPPVTAGVAGAIPGPADGGAARLQWRTVASDTEAPLNTYLVGHSQYVGSGVRGVLPYVRIVGNQPEKGGER